MSFNLSDPRIRHAGDRDDDLFLIQVADVEIGAVAQRNPADGFGGDGGEQYQA